MRKKDYRYVVKLVRLKYRPRLGCPKKPVCFEIKVFQICSKKRSNPNNNGLKEKIKCTSF